MTNMKPNPSHRQCKDQNTLLNSGVASKWPIPDIPQTADKFLYISRFARTSHPELNIHFSGETGVT